MKQIVGGTLTDAGVRTNFVSPRSADWFAACYRDNGLRGGHVISLGPGNDEQALSALRTWPGALQYGGGVTDQNASHYLDAGASHVIVTSFIFERGEISIERLDSIKAAAGRERLVLDLSCRRVAGGWRIATNRWQTLSRTALDADNLNELSRHCAEFLIHAADVEGLQCGIDEELVQLLGRWSNIPVTYAGGAQSIADLKKVNDLSNGRVDLTIGSALDIFGGTGVTLQECLAWNRQHS